MIPHPVDHAIAEPIADKASRDLHASFVNRAEQSRADARRRVDAIGDGTGLFRRALARGRGS